MNRSALLIAALALASCGTDASTPPHPDGLAMVEPTHTTTLEDSTMALVIDGERFDLAAGICNTYDNGTFRFALAEGSLDDEGHATATIERFNDGGGYDVTIAVEGRRVDGSEVSWYARDSRSDHEMTTSLIGGTLEGTARFSNSRDETEVGTQAFGSFNVRCAAPAQSPSP